MEPKQRQEAYPVYRVLASRVQAIDNCVKANNQEWHVRHRDTIAQVVRDFMPSGSGWDCGTKLLLESSRADRLEFLGSFHHMNESGCYDGWTEHRIIVTPSLTSGFDIRITGRDRNEVKEYLYELFHHALTQRIYQDIEEPYNYKLARESS